MDRLEMWVASEMRARMNRVVGHSINLELLDYEFFRDENERGYYFSNSLDAEKWMETWKKELETVDDTLIYMNGVSERELKELKKEPNRYILLVVNHLAGEIIMYPCNEDIPWDRPSFWTVDLLKATGFGRFMDK